MGRWYSGEFRRQNKGSARPWDQRERDLGNDSACGFLAVVMNNSPIAFVYFGLGRVVFSKGLWEEKGEGALVVRLDWLTGCRGGWMTVWMVDGLVVCVNVWFSLLLGYIPCLA